MKNIQVNPDTFRKFLRARAGANAANKRANALRDELGLPEATKSTLGEHILIDGNNNPVGKYNVAAKDAYTVKAGYVGRVS